MVNGTGQTGDKVDEIYKLEDALITLIGKLTTLHRTQDDVKESVEMQIEEEYRQAKADGNTSKIAELSNEKMRKHAVKNALDALEVQLPSNDPDVEGEFISYADLVELIDSAELEKQHLIKDIGFEKRQFVRDYGRSGLQALTDSL